MTFTLILNRSLPERQKWANESGKESIFIKGKRFCENQESLWIRGKFTVAKGWFGHREEVANGRWAGLQGVNTIHKQKSLSVQ